MWAWEGATNRLLQNHKNYSVFDRSKFKLYFNLLIEILSNHFWTCQKGSEFLDFILKCTKIGWLQIRKFF